MTDLQRCLADLEQRIAPDVEDSLYTDWRRFWAGEWPEEVFRPHRLCDIPAGCDWPAVSVNQALDDPDLMALQQLKGCSDMLASGGGGLLCVRSNYGTLILPSLFGVTPYRMADELNTLPTNHPLPGGIDAVRRLLDAPPPDLYTGAAGQALDMGERFRKLFEPYPKVRQYVAVYHPDAQGPMDVCELLIGSQLFTLVYDYPDEIQALLRLVTDTYIRYLRAWFDIWPSPDSGYSVHWALLHRGAVMLRDDSAMNFSPAMFDAFIRPCDQQVLDALGGGVIHFCGKGDHFVPSMAQMNGLYAINPSQPELNDMESIFRSTIDQGMPLLGVSRACVDQARAAGRPLRGLVHSA